MKNEWNWMLDPKSENGGRMMNRIEELEQKAIELYLNEIEWHLIIEMLPNEEQMEYRKLIKEE
tara:strand:+ start:3071 stop:3259 length:189 start_codon:yes stop_codon:yes gene_type:complete